jgi:hypothetical protein
MHKLYKFLFGVLFIAGPLLAQAQSLMPYESAFKGGLQNWAHSFNRFKLADFKPVSPSAKFTNSNTAYSNNLQRFYPAYKSALSASLNGKLVLDIYSYLLLEKKNGRFVSSGSDVEQSILLGDITAKQWRQIAYYGYSQRVQEVIWIDNDAFILAGTRLDKSGKNKPVIIVGNMRQQSLQTFECADTGCYQNTAGYTSPQITALHILHTDH